MNPRPKIHLDTTKASPKSLTTPLKETNGAITPELTESVASLISKDTPSNVSQSSFSTPRTAPKGSDTAHQTHGAVLPADKQITSVAQLLNRGRPVAKGALASYESMAQYRGYLDGLTLHELHRHAVEEARIVPIDDRNRLIRRLEGEYTAVASRYPGRTASPIIQPKGYTPEQMAQMDELKKKMGLK